MVEKASRGETACSRDINKVLKVVSLSHERFPIMGREGYKLEVYDPARSEWRKGEFFVALREELVEGFPGSVVLANKFLRNLGVKEEERERLIGRLETNWDYNQEQEAALEFQNEGFSLTVFNGSVAEPFLKLSEFAVEDFNNPEVRAKYQKVAFGIANQLFSNEIGGYKLWIIEDVIASGETIAGNLALALQQRSLRRGDTIRIDVISATAQGLLLLKKFAEDNGLKLELQVGALSYGLSEGKIAESGARLHANYVVYPDEYLARLREIGLEEVVGRLEKLRGDDRNIYVVGDMGDAFKSLPVEYDEDFPWNRFRKDPHGPRARQGNLVSPSIKQDENLGEIHFYANGGYFMLVAYLLGREDRGVGGVIRVSSAKRVWTDRNPREKLSRASIFYNTGSSYGVLITKSI